MSSTQPTPSNDYTWLRETRLDPETLNSVFGSIASRLKAQESKVADYDAAIELLTTLGIQTITDNLAPAIADVRAELEALQDAALLLSEEIIRIRTEGTDADRVKLAEISGLDGITQVQAAIAELVERVDTLAAATTVALAAKAPLNNPVFTGSVTLPNGRVISASSPGEPLFRVTRSATFTLSSEYGGRIVEITGGTFTVPFSTAASLADGWYCYLVNSGAGTITLDPAGTELINGAATRPLYAGDVVILHCNGASWRSVRLTGNERMVVRDERSSGTHGGEGTAGSYVTRTLNTVVINQIAGASLSANLITLPAGVYRLSCRTVAAASSVRSRIYNVTAGSTLILSGSISASNSVFEHGFSDLVAFAVTTALRLETRMTGGISAINFGAASATGESEIYSEIIIERVAP